LINGPRGRWLEVVILGARSIQQGLDERFKVKLFRFY
jgi:hypothetical protein